MPRVPKMSSSTGGEGVARKSYQVGRMLGNRGSAQPGGGVGQSMVPRSLPQASAGIRGGGFASGVRNYPKGGSSGQANPTYGPEVMTPNTLGAVNAIAGMKVPKARPPSNTKGFTL
jgi:hypothetical protein